MAFIYDLTDTWNAGGTTFNAIKMNVTDTASAAASKLVTLQVGGTEKFSVQKDGFTDVNGNVRLSAASPAIELNLGGPQLYVPAANTFALATGGGIGSPVERLRVDASGNLGIGTSSPTEKLTVSSGDILLSNAYSIKGRNAANTLSIGMLRRNASDQVAIDEDGYGTVIGFGGVLGVFGSGNVGIGTSSPDVELEVSNSSLANAIRVGASSGARELTFQSNASAGTNTIISGGDAASTPLLFSIGPTGSATECMRIDTSGRVGIGTSSPGAKLHVSGTSATSAVVERTSSDTNCNIEYRGSATSVYAGKGAGDIWAVGSAADLSNATTTKFVIDTGNGNVGIGTSSPDAKTNIVVSSTGRAWSPTAGFSDLVVERNANAGFTVVASNTANSYVNFADTDDENAGMIVYQHSDNAMTFRTNGSGEDMRIDSSGNLLVGTATANGKLSVVGDQLSVATGGGAGQMGIQIKGTTLNAIPAAQVQGYIATGNSTIGVAGDLLIAPRTSVAANIRFITGTSPAERMRIDSSGSVGIGTTTPAGKLGVYTLSGVGAVIQVGEIAPTVMQFRNSQNVGGSITIVAGGGTSYNTSSDARLKDNIADAEDAANLIDAIQVRKFDWKADGSHQRYGMVAQELLEVAPEAVSGEPEGDDMMGVDYSKLVPMLIKEIQSLRARVAQLEG